MIHRWRIAVAFGLLAAVVSACAQTQPSRFYVLAPLAQDASKSAEAADRGLRLAVGPVKLPGHLNRDQIVVRRSESELTLLEFDRWAEPLGESLLRVVAENLSALVPTTRIVSYPWNPAVPVEYQVTLDIVRFGVVSGNNVVLAARWQIFDKRTHTLTMGLSSSHKRTAIDSSTRAIVRAMSQVVADLSGEIAAGLRTLRPSASQKKSR